MGFYTQYDLYLDMHTRARSHMCPHECVYIHQRERETERQTDRQTDREPRQADQKVQMVVD